MAQFCTHCGAALEGATVCPACGAVAEDAGTAKHASLADQALNFWKNTPDTSAEFAQEDIRRNRWMALLSYLGLLFLVPLLARKESPFARFHTNQGMLLFIFQVVAVLLGLIPYIGPFVVAVLLVISVMMAIYGIVNALHGSAKELPFIGKYRILK